MGEMMNPTRIIANRHHNSVGGLLVRKDSEVATRNERKRLAKARNVELRLAVAEAFKAEADVSAEIKRKEATFRTYCPYTIVSPNRKLREMDGSGVVATKIYPTEKAFGPLKGNGHNGKGELRRKYI
jgi:hypothetical protein